MSAPVDQSFDEGIPEGSLKEGKRVQAASKQVANMTRGRKEIVGSHAQICLPVGMKQRRRKVFSFLGKELYDLPIALPISSLMVEIWESC